MKTTIAIIGAGPGLGLASARRFGAKGFNVALLSRTQGHVGALAAELADAGITARGYAADVRDHESLNTALARAADELGPVEILQYSPVPSREYLRPVLETTREELRSALEFSALGAAAAVNAVLPGMRAIGHRRRRPRARTGGPVRNPLAHVQRREGLPYVRHASRLSFTRLTLRVGQRL